MKTKTRQCAECDNKFTFKEVEEYDGQICPLCEMWICAECYPEHVETLGNKKSKDNV